MLLDLRQADAEASNVAIEFLCKSVEDTLLFDPHPTDPFLGEVENLGTNWIGRVLHGLYDELVQVLVHGHGRLHKAVDDEDEPCRTLEAKVKHAPPGTLPMSTYLAIIDCLMKKYLPPAVMQSEAQRQAVRQYMAGQVRRRPQPKHGSALEQAEALPETVAEAARRHPLHPQDHARLRIAEASAARHVQDLTASARSRMQKLILDAERRRVGSGEARYAPQPLQQALLDNFGDLNRDYRRLAVTETAINSGDGFLSGCTPGEQVKWLAHRGACDYCRKMDGRIFTVVPTDAADKDPETQVWVGKHAMNIGRSISPRKRTEAGLVEREPHERVMPAQPAHPSCRCIWLRVVHMGSSTSQAA